MTIEVQNESGVEIDELRTQRLARFVMDRMRVHPLAELCVTAVRVTVPVTRRPCFTGLGRREIEASAGGGGIAFAAKLMREAFGPTRTGRLAGLKV